MRRSANSESVRLAAATADQSKLRSVTNPSLPAKRREVVIEVRAERSVGEPEKFEVKSPESFAERLELAEKAQLLYLDVAQLPVRLCLMQHVQQERSIDRYLLGLSHVVSGRSGRDRTINSARESGQISFGNPHLRRALDHVPGFVFNESSQKN